MKEIDQAQKLFASVEITPNFCNTGRAYLTGLGATDSPASTGVQEFYFSRRVKLNTDTKLFSQSLEIPKDFIDVPKPNALMKAFQLLGGALGLNTKNFNIEEIPMPETTSEQLASAKAIHQQLVAGVNAFGDWINAQNVDPAAPTQEEADAVAQAQAAAATVVESAEEKAADGFSMKQFAKLFQDSQNQLNQNLAGLRADFQKATNTPANSFTQQPGGAVNDLDNAQKGQGAL